MNPDLTECIYRSNISIYTFLFYFSAIDLIIFLMFFKNFVNEATESYMRFIGFSFLIMALMSWTIRAYFNYKLSLL